MTELFGPARCMMGGVGLELRRARKPFERAAQFSKTAVPRNDGSRRLEPLRPALSTKKAPREGPGMGAAGLRPIGGLLLRSGSFRDPKQERPRSIASLRRRFQGAGARMPAQATRRAKRRLPTCSTRPSSSAARHVEAVARRRASPSSFTPPCPSSRRASLLEIAEGAGDQRRQVDLRRRRRLPARCSPRRTSGISSGTSRCTCTRSKCGLGGLAPPPSSWKRSTSRRASARFASTGAAPAGCSSPSSSS